MKDREENLNRDIICITTTMPISFTFSIYINTHVIDKEREKKKVTGSSKQNKLHENTTESGWNECIIWNTCAEDFT